MIPIGTFQGVIRIDWESSPCHISISLYLRSEIFKRIRIPGTDRMIRNRPSTRYISQPGSLRPIIKPILWKLYRMRHQLLSNTGSQSFLIVYYSHPGSSPWVHSAYGGVHEPYGFPAFRSTRHKASLSQDSHGIF